MIFSSGRFRAAALFFPLLLGACGEDYPLLANGYPKTARLTAMDDQGKGNFSQPVEPKGCMFAFHSKPDIGRMQIEVYIENEMYKAYDSAALKAALGQEDFSQGIFVVDPSGLHFVRGFDCESEIR